MCVCVHTCVHTHTSGLFPRLDHAHWLAAREAASQHVHDRGQVRARRRPPLTRVAGKVGRWGSRTLALGENAAGLFEACFFHSLVLWLWTNVLA